MVLRAAACITGTRTAAATAVARSYTILRPFCRLKSYSLPISLMDTATRHVASHAAGGMDAALAPADPSASAVGTALPLLAYLTASGGKARTPPHAIPGLAPCNFVASH